MSKILVAVPTFESIYPDTFKAIYEACIEAVHQGHEILFDFIRGYDCATARNNIIITAQSKNADYVLMVDNDVIIPKNAIEWLYDHNEEVVLGYYAHRDTDNIYRGNTCICKRYDNYGQLYFNYPLDSEYSALEMKAMRDEGTYKIQIHGGGMGCAFIHMPVIEKLDYPWYDWVNYADDHRGMLSEDLYFCENLKRHDIPIYTDTRVECGHIMRKAQWCDVV